jgi:hypothetical protein
MGLTYMNPWGLPTNRQLASESDFFSQGVPVNGRLPRRRKAGVGKKEDRNRLGKMPVICAQELLGFALFSVNLLG